MVLVCYLFYMLLFLNLVFGKLSVSSFIRSSKLISNMEGSSYDDQQIPDAILVGIKFDVSTDTDMEKMSVLTIESPSEISDPKLGFPNWSNECSTCGAKDLKYCEGHFGVIEFPYTILHPYFISEIAKILNKICPGCKAIREYMWIKVPGGVSRKRKLRSCKYCSGSSINWYPPMKFKVSSDDLFSKSAIIVEVSENSSTRGKKGRRRALAADYWDFIPNDEQQDESCVKPTRRILSPSQVHYILCDVDPEFIKKFISRTDSIFLNRFPVTPNNLRVTEIGHSFSNSQRLIFDERTRANKKLVDFRGTANELSSHVVECLKISKIHAEKATSDDIAYPQIKNTDICSNSSGLRFMKDVVLGKRNDHCFRMVVVGNPSLKLSEIGVPCHVAERLQISEQLNNWTWERLAACCDLRLLEKGEIHIRRKGNLVRIRCTDDLQIGDTIYRPLSDGDTVLVNRPPSIHQHSLIALSANILPVNSVVSLNPLICPPFRGDFDGDCFHGYVPQSIDTRVELNELVALNKQLINGQSGRNLLSLSQDSLTAAYLVKDDAVLLNLHQMQQLEMFCPKQMPSAAIVKAPSKSFPVWTGNQLLSMLLPSGFEYSFPSNGVLISNGEVVHMGESTSWLKDAEGNIFQSLTEQYQGKVLDFLYAAQEVLCEWLSMRGLSVSLLDLYLASDSHSRRNMMEEIFFGLQEAEQACIFRQLMVDSSSDFLAGHDEDRTGMALDVEGMCYQKQRSAALSQASADAFKQVFKDIQNLAYKYGSKENSLLTMFKAGSKGNLLKLVQHSMCVGLQHSLAPLSFRLPHELSCSAWNNQKMNNSIQGANGTVDNAKKYIPSGIVQSSFLEGLNPLECFVHSVTNRDSSFSDNADLPGTLSRRLMFFMRDLYSAYDGTVRNSYGNQVVEFSYDIDTDICGPVTRKCDLIGKSFAVPDGLGRMGGEPVGSLSACAISEAAYGALDQPISLLETSPLLNMKNVLECGSKKRKADRSMSLFLSDKLGRARYGFEYGALEVKTHLERLAFLDIVSTVMIIFSPQTCSQRTESPWVCHFHISKEIVRRGLQVHSIIGSLQKHCDAVKKKLKGNFPSLRITSKDCSHVNRADEDDMFCVTATVVENPKGAVALVQVDMMQDRVIPFLLGTVIKGFEEIKKVEILWKDQPKSPKAHKYSNGELYLRVTMSGEFGVAELWSILMNDCLQKMDMIDWTRSHPDNVLHFCWAYGIDAGWKYFLNNLESAILDTGRNILPEHLILVADCLSASGEFVGLNSKGLSSQRELVSVPSPFVQACFSNPSACFVKAAKAGTMDNLQGVLDALAWGKMPPTVTGGQFDIVMPVQGWKLVEPVDVYGFLRSESVSPSQNVECEIPNMLKQKSDKCASPVIHKYGGFTKIENVKKISRSFLRSFLTVDDILKLSNTLKSILHKYSIDQKLSEADRKIVMMALHFHPRRNEKMGTGALEIKVGNHPEHKNRCFHLVKMDGTTEDFSYRKCVYGALEIIDPGRAKSYRTKWSRGGKE